MKVLYPTSGSTNIKDWDIQMITGVLLTIFKKGLDEDEKEAVREIKFVRNEIYAHRTLEPLTHSKYEEVRKDLVAALELLSSKLDKPIQLKCKEVIKVCTESRLDKPTVDKLLEGISKMETLSNKILNRLDQMSNELRQKMEEEHEKTRKENVENRNFVVGEIRKILKDEERRKQKLVTVTVLDTELTLTGDKGQHEVIDEAEKIILFVFNEAIKRAGSTEYPLVMKAVHELLTEINSIPDVEVLPAEPKCILVKFRCKSYEGLLNLLIYLEHEAYTKCLNKIVDAVCATLPLTKPIHLISKLNPESLKGIMNLIVPVESETLYSRTIKLPIKVTSLGGMAEVYILFENGGTTNSFDKVSEPISSHLGAKITLKQSLNVEQVKKELKSARETETHYQSENKEECPDIENKDTNEVFKGVFVKKSADYVPSKDTEFEDFDSRETLSSLSLTDSYEEEETDETYASPRMKRKKDFREFEDINKLLRSLILIKSKYYEPEPEPEPEPSSDSGFYDVASSKVSGDSLKAVSLARPSGASKEGKEESKEISIGMPFEMRYPDDLDVQVSSVGPFVSIAGMHSKCFMTICCKPSNDISSTVISSKRNVNILADNRNVLLVAVNESGSSEDGDPAENILIQANRDFLTKGMKVYKVGVSGYTEGIVLYTQRVSTDGDYIFVESLPGSHTPFAQTGDCGSAVFCQKNGMLCCIGMLCGQLTWNERDNQFLVFYIDFALDEMQKCYGKQITLDQDEMNLKLSKCSKLMALCQHFIY